jgi:hypothetical protein
MELRVHLVAVRINEAVGEEDSVVDVEAIEVDVVEAAEEDVERQEEDLERREVDLERQEEDEVDSTLTNPSEVLTAKRKCKTRRSLSTTKLKL